MWNIAKQASWPGEWASDRYPDSVSRGGYLAAHDLSGLPDSFNEFLEFYERRRQIIFPPETHRASSNR